ncbi:hypothetical protein, partial [Pseudomonas sp. FG-3G]
DGGKVDTGQADPPRSRAGSLPQGSAGLRRTSNQHRPQPDNSV